MAKIRPSLRHKARCLAVQAIYQWQLAEASPAEIQREFYDRSLPDKVDLDYFSVLLQGVTKDKDRIDAQYTHLLDRPLKEIGPVELAILRLATFELLERMDIPFRVVINEALRLAKLFGAEDGFKYINAVLDQVARKTRATESREKR
ncbi:MAG: transcription antitermination factor NusB [Gammaproteobacteria bacterium]